MKRVLLKNKSATDATKVEFTVSRQELRFGFPSIKCRGIGSGDSVRIWEKVAGGWDDSPAYTIDEDSDPKSVIIQSAGRYAVDVVVATGPVFCEYDWGSSQRFGGAAEVE